MTKFLLYMQRRDITANSYRPFYWLHRTACWKKKADRWRTFRNSDFVICRLLLPRHSVLFNQESFTELNFYPTNSGFFCNSDSCRYKLYLQKFIAFVRQLFGRSLVNRRMLPCLEQQRHFHYQAWGWQCFCSYLSFSRFSIPSGRFGTVIKQAS